MYSGLRSQEGLSGEVVSVKMKGEEGSRMLVLGGGVGVVFCKALGLESSLLSRLCRKWYMTELQGSAPACAVISISPHGGLAII